jgi:murein DD-endopeptidase MepM/ murein hydrolase activator NlpD
MNERWDNFRRRVPRGTGFYVALSLAVVVMGLGVWAAVNNNLRNNHQGYTEPRQTIRWEDFTTVAPITVTEAETTTGVRPVVDPVQHEPDERPAAVRSDNLPFTGEFALPFGTNIVKDFSHGELVRSVTMGDWRVHNGVSFGGQQDQQILAIQDGVVQSVANDPLWGWIVTVDHGHGVVARYKGLQENSAPAVGRAVSKAESIGQVGHVPVGAAHGVHMHLEIRVNGQIEDPLAVMNRVGNR